MTRWYFIRPHDVWMFRGAKPFTAGQGFVARSDFPPTPQTMQGIIRTHILELSGVDWDAYAQRQDETLIEIIGAPAWGELPAELGRFKITGPFVARQVGQQVTRLNRVPLDVLKHKELEQYHVLSPQPAAFISNVPVDWKPLGIAASEMEDASGWLEDEHFAAYLEGHSIQNLISTDSIFQYDERVGLGLDYARRAAEESLLYHVEFIRPKEDMGLLVGVTDEIADLLGKRGVMGTGGESRFSSYEKVAYTPPPIPTAPGDYKVVLLTPAYFEQGWQPTGGDWSYWVGHGRLVSVALGKPQGISGWDIANRRPKALYHYLPAGSVFYFENATLAPHPFTETPVGELDYARLGFGAFAIGLWS